MIVRELITRLGFSVDEAGVKKYEAAAGRALQKVGAAAGQVQAVFGGIGVQLAAAFGVNAIFNLARDADELAASLDAVNRGTGQQVKTIGELVPIANEARTSVQALTESYISLMRAGLKEQDALDVSRLIGMTGATQSAIYQLMQALSSGRLQGDELRSVLESGGNLDNAIAKGLGVSVGALRDMAKEGKLTTEVIVGALRKSEQYIKDNRSSAVTLSQAMTTLGNSMFGVVAGSEEASAGVRLLTTAVLWLGDHTGVLSGVFAVFLGGAAVGFLAWVATAVVAVGSLAGAFGALALALLANPITWIVAGLAALAFAIQDVYKWVTGGDSLIGKWLGPWEDVVAKVKAVWSDFLSWINSTWDAFRTVAVGAIDGVLSGISARIETAIADPWGTLWSMTLPGMLESAVPGLFDPLRNSFTEAMNWMRGAWDTLISGLSSVIPDWVRQGVAWLTGGGSAQASASGGVQVDGAFAGGGYARAGGTYLVGENGPELFSPKKSGWVVPSWLSMASGGLGGFSPRSQTQTIRNELTVNVEVPMAAGGDPENARRAGMIAADEVVRIVEQKFRGIVQSTLASFPETV